VSRSIAVIVAADGRPLGARAVHTRSRLLDATAKLLQQNGVLELKIVDISREVGTSTATFYQYFVDVEAAILALVDQATVDEWPLVSYLTDAWDGHDGLAKAGEFVDAYLNYWEDHSAVLRMRNLKAEEGHPAFREARSKANLLMIDALITMVRSAQDAGRLPPEMSAFVVASAMLAMIERLFAYRDKIALRGASAESLRDTLALLLYRSLTGR
jgi:AcrR family transcriptional regulator